MMKNKPHKPYAYIPVTIIAEIHGDRAKLIDKSGRGVGNIDLAEIGLASNKTLLAMQWKRWAESQKAKSVGQNSRKSEWARAILTLQKAWCLRARDKRTSSKARYTPDLCRVNWKEAIIGMRAQLKNRIKKAARTEWEIFAENARRNSLKRSVSRYGND